MQVQKQKGFTLIEMLIVIVISAILFSFAFPFGRDFILRNKIMMRTEEIVSALHYARSQANLLGKSLVLTPCNGKWSSGLQLFMDNNNNHALDDGDKLLFTWQWTDGDFSLVWQGMYAQYLVFTPAEFNSVLNGSFYLCPLSSSIKGQKIIMNRVGRIRVEEDTKNCHT